MLQHMNDNDRPRERQPLALGKSIMKERLMLVLTRSIGERLIINDGEIKLSVLEVKGNQVRIGIDAPRDVSVHREEVFERIRAESQEKSDTIS